MAIFDTPISHLVFAVGICGFSVQRFIEIIIPTKMDESEKKRWSSGVALALGILLTISLHLGTTLCRALGLGFKSQLDTDLFYTGATLILGLFISAGTEGANSLLKLFQAAKEVRQAEVDIKKQSLGLLGEIRLERASAKTGEAVQGAVSLNSPATERQLVTLTTSDLTVLDGQWPLTVEIPVGSRTGMFTVKTKATATTGTKVTISATASDGSAKQVSLTIDK